MICRFKMANLSFLRVPGQDLAENGPFAFKPHKEFIGKNTAFVLENFVSNLNFQRVPGQDLAENGPFAFKPHKEFIKKNTASILEKLAARAFKKESCRASMDREPWAGGM